MLWADQSLYGRGGIASEDADPGPETAEKMELDTVRLHFKVLASDCLDCITAIRRQIARRLIPDRVSLMILER